MSVAITGTINSNVHLDNLVSEPRISMSHMAVAFGMSVSELLSRISTLQRGREFLSIAELANRWRCSRGTAYNWLRRAGGGSSGLCATREARQESRGDQHSSGYRTAVHEETAMTDGKGESLR